LTTRRKKAATPATPATPRRKSTSLTAALPGRIMGWIGLISITAVLAILVLHLLGYDPLQRFLIEKSYKTYNGFGIRMPTRYAIHGIDVSQHQGGINWPLVKGMKDGDIQLRFVFIKATEGLVLKDRNFSYNWKEAGKQGLLRGAYHYFKPRTDAIQQARHFCKAVKLRPGDLPPVLDVEERGNLTRAELARRVQLWLNEVEAQTGVTPLLYTNKHFYEKNLRDWLDRPYPLWIAHYYVPELALEDSGAWRFWQHNDKGRVDGIDEPVDFNVFYGKEKELEKLRIK